MARSRSRGRSRSRSNSRKRDSSSDEKDKRTLYCKGLPWEATQREVQDLEVFSAPV